ncbi:MAG: ribonuclease [Oscillospiraceae bacterium]|nr:ribonuclease [Oscillospiraceae bacterium]
MKLKKILPVVLLLLLVWFFLPDTGNSVTAPAPTAAALQTVSPAQTPKPTAAPTPAPTKAPTPAPTEAPAEEAALDENSSYTTKEDVALYIHTYGHLPPNFMTKKEAEAAGWSGGALDRVVPGMCIGGDRFGNYEGLLPKAKGRQWTECDINTLGAKSRGPERIVFSNDGLIYYTPDHYESFELLYD